MPFSKSFGYEKEGMGVEKFGGERKLVDRQFITVKGPDAPGLVPSLWQNTSLLRMFQST